MADCRYLELVALARVQIPSTVYLKFHLVRQPSVLITYVSQITPLLERQANPMKSRLVEIGIVSLRN